MRTQQIEEGILKIPQIETQLDNITNSSTNWVNVKEIGCDNTGVINCSNILNSLVNKDCTLYFPKGTYYISENIVITANVKIISDNAVITFDCGRCFTTIEGGHTVSVAFENILFRDKSKSIRSQAIMLYNTKDVNINNCTFDMKYNSTAFWIRENSENVYVNNCVFDVNYNDEGGSVWVWCYNTTGYIKNVTFDNCTFKHTSLDECVAIWGNGTINDVNFNNCKFSNYQNDIKGVMYLSLYAEHNSSKLENIKYNNCQFNLYGGYNAVSLTKNMVQTSFLSQQFNKCKFNTNKSIEHTIQLWSNDECVEDFLIDGCDFENVKCVLSHNHSEINMINTKIKNCSKAVWYQFNDLKAITRIDNCILYGTLFLDNGTYENETYINNCKYFNTDEYIFRCIKHGSYAGDNSGVKIEVKNSHLELTGINGVDVCVFKNMGYSDYIIKNCFIKIIKSEGTFYINKGLYDISSKLLYIKDNEIFCTIPLRQKTSSTFTKIVFNNNYNNYDVVNIT